MCNIMSKREINKLTLEMIMPAMLMRILGPFSRRYLKSTPFQKDTKYRLIYICSKKVKEREIEKI